MSRYKSPVGWRQDNYRHYLAAKYGSAGRRYNYVPTYVASDLPLIGADAIGTAGASTVAMLPVAVPAVLAYGTVKFLKGKHDKEKAKEKRKYNALQRDLTEEEVESIIRKSKEETETDWEGKFIKNKDFERELERQEIEHAKKSGRLVFGGRTFNKIAVFPVEEEELSPEELKEKRREEGKFIKIHEINPYRRAIAEKYSRSGLGPSARRIS